MTELRILLVEEDEGRVGQLEARLGSASHSVVSVPNLAEAAEALLLQKFEVVMIGSGQPDEELSSFVTKMRTLEAQQPAGSQVAIISCTSSLAGLASLDGSLPEEFDAAQLSKLLDGISTSSSAAASHAESARGNLAVFEPELFQEQCANEAELMIEIIDLFVEECIREIPEMAEALESGSYERLSRLAHTIKGSLGSLHAPAAWCQAQDLESAAKLQNLTLCAAALDRLKLDIEELNEHLKRFRELCMAR